MKREASVASTTTAPGQGISEGSAPDASLPSFEEVCCLQYATIRHIPQKARPAFAQVLSDTLRSICVSNSEEAWLKLFMLPKCVLRASHRGGQRHKSHSIEELCRQWSDGHIASLWQYASAALIMLGSPTPNNLRSKQRRQIRRFSLQFLRLEKGYWGRLARSLYLQVLPPTFLRHGICSNRNTLRAQFLPYLISLYLQGPLLCHPSLKCYSYSEAGSCSWSLDQPCQM